MATHTNSSSDRSKIEANAPHRLTRYDLVLAVIPTAFLLGLLATGLAGVPPRVAMGSAAAIGALALVDGLFLNPPRPPTRSGDGRS